MGVFVCFHEKRKWRLYAKDRHLLRDWFVADEVPCFFTGGPLTAGEFVWFVGVVPVAVLLDIGLLYPKAMEIGVVESNSEGVV